MGSHRNPIFLSTPAEVAVETYQTCLGMMAESLRSLNGIVGHRRQDERMHESDMSIMGVMKTQVGRLEDLVNTAMEAVDAELKCRADRIENRKRSSHLRGAPRRAGL
jgi:hypothetical protein